VASLKFLTLRKSTVLNNFLPDLQLVFERLVDITEPICQDLDPGKLPCQSLFLQASRLLLLKIILNIQTALSNSFISMVISVMFISLVFSLMGLVSLKQSLFIIKIFSILILKFFIYLIYIA